MNELLFGMGQSKVWFWWLIVCATVVAVSAWGHKPKPVYDLSQEAQMDTGIEYRIPLLPCATPEEVRAMIDSALAERDRFKLLRDTNWNLYLYIPRHPDFDSAWDFSRARRDP